MNTIIPTTVPYLITFKGILDVYVNQSDGHATMIRPVDTWFSCRGTINNVEWIVLFDNSNIGFVALDDDMFINQLKDSTYMGVSVTGYNRCFLDFVNSNFKFKIE